jgi:predicted RNase H-like HicB family nuclease
MNDVKLEDYKVVLYRNRPSGWVAEVPAIEGCYALMPTRQEALAELSHVFEMIAAEYVRPPTQLQPLLHLGLDVESNQPGATPVRDNGRGAG